MNELEQLGQTGRPERQVPYRPDAGDDRPGSAEPASGRPQQVRYRLDAGDDPRSAERGLAQLVLTIVELLRQLMERQALRRVEDGTVTEEQAERIGYTLMKLEERMGQLLDEFGLEPEDLNIDLGPLGPLLDH